MQTLTDIKTMLSARGIRPRHRLGQNFLHDQNLIRKLIDASAIAKCDTPIILEVGPGTGALTEAIVESSAMTESHRRIILCELDETMADIVADRLDIDSTESNITLIRGDALASKHSINPAIVAAIDGRPFKLVANLPYNIASPLMMNLLVHHHDDCRGMFVTIQKEVADRLLGQPGSKTYGPMSIIAQTLATVELIATLPPSCFWPQPDVTSAMVSLLPSSAVELPGDRAKFARFVTELFMKRRKQLGSIFGGSSDGKTNLPETIDPQLRPDALAPAQVVMLWKQLRAD